MLLPPFSKLTLSLLVLGIFTDYHNAAMALDNLALIADLFYGRLNFHSIFPPFSCSSEYSSPMSVKCEIPTPETEQGSAPCS